MRIDGLQATVEVDATKVKSGIEHVRDDVLKDRSRCPECDGNVVMECVVQDREHGDDEAMSVLVDTECDMCAFSHSLLAGVGMEIDVPSPKGLPAEDQDEDDDESRGFRWGGGVL